MDEEQRAFFKQEKNRARMIDDILPKIDTIPVPGPVLTYVLNAVNDDSSTLNEIARQVQSDNALAANVLRLSNSAYEYRKKIESIQDAVIWLGLGRIQVLIARLLGMEIQVHHSREHLALEIREHSLLTAICCRVISARYSGKSYPDENYMFTLGMLHDVGRLVILNYFYDAFVEIETLQRNERLKVEEAEDRVMNITHSEITRRLLGDVWKLPEEFHAPIQYHHRPRTMSYDFERYRLPVFMLHLGNAVADFDYLYRLCHERDKSALLKKDVINSLDDLDLTPDFFDGKLYAEILAQFKVFSLPEEAGAGLGS